MIFFVGDKPSAKNVDPLVPFVGTKSYKRLLEWIYLMNIDINNTFMCNIVHVKPYGFDNAFFIEVSGWQADIMEEDKIVALGNNASKFLTDKSVDHFKLPHPSGSNFKLNDKKYVKNILKECETWLKDM